ATGPVPAAGGDEPRPGAHVATALVAGDWSSEGCGRSLPRTTLLSVRGHAREDLLEPLRGLLLVHLLRIHQLAGKNLLGLHEHLLLAGGEPLLVIAQGQVAHHLGQLEDVTGLHLVPVVLETP